MRAVNMTRTEAEALVDLLESANPLEVGTWRVDLASDIRKAFGMVPMEEENQSRIKDGRPPIVAALNCKLNRPTESQSRS